MTVEPGRADAPRRIQEVWVRGLAAGALAAALDMGLILAVEPTVSRWVLLRAALFWVIAGWVVVGCETGLRRYAHGILTTVLLNLPWYVLESFEAGHPEHFGPLVAMSVVFGTGFAWARGRASGSTVAERLARA